MGKNQTTYLYNTKVCDKIIFYSAFPVKMLY
jgi:hypothetical protein